MVDKRPKGDRILVAPLTGEARHRAKWRPLTADEEAAAVDALRELADGRADLLAQVAGILKSASAGRHDEPLARQAAGLCRKAGAGPEAIEVWIEEGGARGPLHHTVAFRRTALIGTISCCSALPHVDAFRHVV